MKLLNIEILLSELELVLDKVLNYFLPLSIMKYKTKYNFINIISNEHQQNLQILTFSIVQRKFIIMLFKLNIKHSFRYKYLKQKILQYRYWHEAILVAIFMFALNLFQSKTKCIKG